jgi:hypothetical protein
MELGDIEQAQKHFQMVLEMEAPEDLRGLARNGLREIAVRGLKARGPRMDAVFYLLDALRLFRGKSLEEIREISFEIRMLGRHGLDINDPQETHVLRALPGGCSRRRSWCASCMRGSRGSSRGWMSGWIWARSGDGGEVS